MISFPLEDQQDHINSWKYFFFFRYFFPPFVTEEKYCPGIYLHHGREFLS